MKRQSGQRRRRMGNAILSGSIVGYRCAPEPFQLSDVFANGLSSKFKTFSTCSADRQELPTTASA